MAQKKTYIYRVCLRDGGNKLLNEAYYYGRNLASVKRAVEARRNVEKEWAIPGAVTSIDKVGEMKLTIFEPVAAFTEEETAQIHRYFLKEQMRYAVFNRLNGLSGPV